MKALGLMEFRGYVPAIEGLDTALKAANVGLLRCSKDGGGLVSVFITGDVGAVNAAIAAVQGTLPQEELLETSVIPRPAEQVAQLLENMPRAPKAPEPSSGAPSAAKAEESSGDASPEAAPKALPHLTQQSEGNDLPMHQGPDGGTAPEAQPSSDPLAELEEELLKEEKAVREKLSSMTLKELRAAALSMRIEGWSAEKIKKAPRQKLIAAIMREQER